MGRERRDVGTLARRGCSQELESKQSASPVLLSSDKP